MSVRSHKQNTPQRQSDDKQRGRQPGTQRANARKNNRHGGEEQELNGGGQRYSRNLVEETHLDMHGFAFVLRGFGCKPSIGTRYMGRGKQTYVPPKVVVAKPQQRERRGKAAQA